MENQPTDVYVTLEGGKDEIENFEATIALEKQHLKRALLAREIMENGIFDTLFRLDARRSEIAFATSHLINPTHREKMLELLNFHAWLEPYLLGLAGEVAMRETIIAELESEIENRMGK